MAKNIHESVVPAVSASPPDSKAAESRLVVDLVAFCNVIRPCRLEDGSLVLGDGNLDELEEARFRLTSALSDGDFATNEVQELAQRAIETMLDLRHRLIDANAAQAKSEQKLDVKQLEVANRLKLSRVAQDLLAKQAEFARFAPTPQNKAAAAKPKRSAQPVKIHRSPGEIAIGVFSTACLVFSILAPVAFIIYGIYTFIRMSHKFP